MKTPESIQQEIANLSVQWKELAETVSFGESTLAEYNAFVKPPLDARATLKENDAQRKDWMKMRDEADKVSHPEAHRIVMAILSHKQFGPSSSLSQALGYVTDDEKTAACTAVKGATKGATGKQDAIRSTWPTQANAEEPLRLPLPPGDPPSDRHLHADSIAGVRRERGRQAGTEVVPDATAVAGPACAPCARVSVFGFVPERFQ